jgi:hypothetical protein
VENLWKRGTAPGFLLPLIVGILAITAFQLKVRHGMIDFSVYRQAAVRLTHAQPLYQASDGHYQFKYLPAFALVAAPLAQLDAEAGKMIWFALSVGALVLLVRWSVRFLPERRRSIGLLAALTFTFMAKFYFHELNLGQANLFFGVLVVSAIGALQVDADAVGGALLGAALCIKPYGVLFAPWLAANSRADNRRAIVAFATVCFIALIAPAAVYGFKGNFQLLADWWRTVSDTTAPNLTGTDNVSFAAMWAKWIGAGVPARILAGVTSAAGLGVVIDAWMHRNEEIGDPIYLEAAALLVLVPLLSPQGWDYVLLLSTPALALIIDRVPELPRRWKVAAWTSIGVMGFAIFDLVGRAIYTRVMSWSVITLCAIGVLACLSKLRRLRLA